MYHSLKKKVVSNNLPSVYVQCVSLNFTKDSFKLGILKKYLPQEKMKTVSFFLCPQKYPLKMRCFIDRTLPALLK